MLKSRAPYAEIQAKFGISSKTIAAIAKDAGIVQRHRDGAKTKETVEPREASPAIQVAGSGQVQDSAVLAKLEAVEAALQEYHAFFKKIAADPASFDKELDHLNVEIIDKGVKIYE